MCLGQGKNSVQIVVQYTQNNRTNDLNTLFIVSNVNSVECLFQRAYFYQVCQQRIRQTTARLLNPHLISENVQLFKASFCSIDLFQDREENNLRASTSYNRVFLGCVYVYRLLDWQKLNMERILHGFNWFQW